MALSLVSGPATEPLTIAEIRAHLRLDTSAGEPAPTAPTVALVTAAGNVTAGAHRVLWTFVTTDGETEAGIASASVTTDGAHGQIDSSVPIGGTAVIARRGYMTAAGGSTFLRIVEIADNSTTTYRINIADAGLGVQAPTVNTTADPELLSWLTAARQHVETFTHRALITQTWDLSLDGFPESDWLCLPMAPLVSVTSVTYVDANGVTQTWSASLYTVDAPTGPHARPGRLAPAFGQCFPVTRDQPNAVTVRFVAGYGAASSVPGPIKSAMKLLIGHWWLNREAGVNPTRGSGDILPFGVDSLLWPYKAF